MVFTSDVRAHVASDVITERCLQPLGTALAALLCLDTVKLGVDTCVVGGVHGHVARVALASAAPVTVVLTCVAHDPYTNLLIPVVWATFKYSA